MPLVGRARAQAQSVVCLANLRAIAGAMLTYVMDNDGWLPGSPSTTGAALWRLSDDGRYASAGHLPEGALSPAIELFDWIGPLAQAMGVRLPETGVERLRAYRELARFACPAARGRLARWAGGAQVEDGPMLSYCTGTAFMLLPARIPTTANTSLAGRVTMPTGGSDNDPSKFNFWSSPPGYVPRLDRVGQPSRKVFLADSGRRSRFNRAPEFIYNVESDYVDTLFADFGPFYGVSRSYDRYVANNPGAEGAIDARVYAYRHGASASGRGAYRMNVVFYDAHAETVGDMESARPDWWLPAGSVIYRNTKLNAADTVFWADVWRTYLAGTAQTSPYVVP